jgi:hypothetical protein
MTQVPRAVEKGEAQGFMRFWSTRRAGRFWAPRSWVRVVTRPFTASWTSFKAPYTVLQRAMHIHPTVSELIPTMLGELKPL